MKRLLSNIVKYVLIVVFVYYYVGNTAFVHTHVVDNFLITHSHPYLPGMHHSHTEAQWETVSWFNLLCLDSSHELPIVPFILFFLSFIFLLHGANRIVRTAGLSIYVLHPVMYAENRFCYLSFVCSLNGRAYAKP